jgi:ADP-ribose pyrophosphatase YjhB (NUDIX family)
MLNPRITVAAIAEDTGRFLFVEETVGGRRLFNQPAGHVEADETLVAAVVREAREESAWRFEPQDLVGVYLWRAPEADTLFLRFAFCGVVRDHDALQSLDEGILRTHWLTPEELRQRAARVRSPLVLRSVDDYRTGMRRGLAAVADLGREAIAASLAPDGRHCAAGPVTVVAP